MPKRSPPPAHARYRVAMSQRPFVESFAAPSPDATEPAPEPWPEPDAVESSAASGASTLSSWATFAAVTIAVIGLVVAIVGWFRHPSHDSALPAFSGQQVMDAKAVVCAGYTTVHRAVVNTHLESPPDSGPTDDLAVAISARLALYGGGTYFRDRLSAEPAIPGDLGASTSTIFLVHQLSPRIGRGRISMGRSQTQIGFANERFSPMTDRTLVVPGTARLPKTQDTHQTTRLSATSRYHDGPRRTDFRSGSMP